MRFGELVVGLYNDTKALYCSHGRSSLMSCRYNLHNISIQIKSGIKLTLRCHNSSETESDQGFKCKDFEQPYPVVNSALNAALFGKTHRVNDRPTGQITNTEKRDPLVEWVYQFGMDLAMERSRKKDRGACVDTVEDANDHRARNEEEYDDDGNSQRPKRRRT
jgi:hypothetical protein